MNNTDPSLVWSDFAKSMSTWENSIPKRIKEAELNSEEGEAARVIMKEYSEIINHFCSAELISDNERRRISLHYESPSPYGFMDVKNVELIDNYCKIRCSDRRPNYSSDRVDFHMIRSDGGEWKIDRLESVPPNGDAPFVMAV